MLIIKGFFSVLTCILEQYRFLYTQIQSIFIGILWKPIYNIIYNVWYYLNMFNSVIILMSKFYNFIIYCVSKTLK